MIKLTYLQTMTTPEQNKGPVWVNPAHIAFMSAGAAGGTLIRMSSGELVLVIEDAAEISASLRVMRG